ncbi:MAG: GNAT family N-acetyltransferase [Gordonia sp. (in: high G+C Gram-positive bacteria)]|uniref:GNAT family N-acetyltransferase n=1 Tax=Gordonia sp. (in: high G+C Gram-positive bacteria) TaxID=84139 RepID=UPI0039E5CF73
MLLNTRRLLLRPVVTGDAELLAALDSDPAVMRFVSGGAPTALRTVTEWVIPRMQEQQREYGTGMWTAFEHGDRRFAGWVQLRTPRHSRADELELSYRFRREVWGRGLVTEAAAALIGATFDRNPATRIFASTQVAHTASRAVLMRLGMRLAAAADARVLTDPEADVEYELLRGHWLATRSRHSAGHLTAQADMTA